MGRTKMMNLVFTRGKTNPGNAKNAPNYIYIYPGKSSRNGYSRELNLGHSLRKAWSQIIYSTI